MLESLNRKTKSSDLPFYFDSIIEQQKLVIQKEKTIKKSDVYIIAFQTIKPVSYKNKETKIVCCCANIAGCSGHIPKKKTRFSFKTVYFFIHVVVFFDCVMKGSKESLN